MDEIQIQRLLNAFEETSQTLKTMSEQLSENNKALAEQVEAIREVANQLHNIDQTLDLMR